MFVKFLIINVLLFGGLDAIVWGSIRQQMTRECSRSVLLSGVVPDVIDNVPRILIEIQYKSGVSVECGNQLTPLSTRDEPTVKWTAYGRQYYTLAMVDPDAPSRADPSRAQYKHWLIVNIPGSDLSGGQILAPYKGPTPPQGSGPHRYITLVYRQSGFLKNMAVPVDPDSDENRILFDIRKFAQDNKLGQPIASNFFEALSDNYSNNSKPRDN